MDSVIEKLLEIYNNKISKKLKLTEDEKAFIKKYLPILNETDAVDEELKKAYFTHCALDNTINLKEAYRINLLRTLGDEAFFELLKKKQTLPSLARLAAAIKDVDSRKQFVYELGEPLRMYLTDYYVFNIRL